MNLSELLNLGISEANLNRILASIAVIAGLVLLRRLLMRLVQRRSSADLEFIYRLRKTSTYLSVLIGLLIIGRIWVEGLKDLVTFLGLLSAGLAIALKDLVSNVAGWLFIIWRRPFNVGDRIQLGEHHGDVIDVRLFQFTILEIGNWVAADQTTGRIIHIPNGRVLTDPLVNYTRGFRYIWVEIPVLVTFESNWKKAKQLMEEVMARHAEPVTEEASRQLVRAAHRYLLPMPETQPAVYTTVADSGVLLTGRLPCDARSRRDLTEAIWEDILTVFSQNDDIDFAYPTIRYYDNVTEGKPEARAEKG
ncbi:MAG: mechanosensitive ion channel family protein [Gemmatimonadales bacterium]